MPVLASYKMPASLLNADQLLTGSGSLVITSLGHTTFPKESQHEFQPILLCR